MPLMSESGWQLTASGEATPQDLKILGRQPPVEREFGVTSVTRRTYSKEGISVTVFFEQATDPSSTYGLLTFYQSTDMHPVQGVQLAVAGPKEALMARGRYFIRVAETAGGELSHHDLHSLLVKIGGAKLTVENEEKLPQTLPKRGLVQGTEKYLLGTAAAGRVLGSFPVSAIGFEDGVEALVGTYVSGGEKLRLLSISYPTPQLAQVKYKDIQAALHKNGSADAETVYGRLQGSYALLVLNAKSAGSAQRLLNQFRLSQYLTWSPRRNPDASMAYQLVSLVLANFELIGVIAVFATLAGIVAAIVKHLIIKHFPESSLSRRQDNQLTKLKLS
ncbi:MAG TPA: DUF6599 family protein [Terriglobia bacterium]|nr:DUF6599 family protein [Terriglobia bacterium]